MYIHEASSERWLGGKKTALVTTIATEGGACQLSAAYEQLRASIAENQFGGGRFGLMLLLREGLPGWLGRAAQLLAGDSKGSEAATLEDLASRTTEAAADIPGIAPPSFSELVSIMSNLVIPTIEEVQHGS